MDNTFFKMDKIIEYFIKEPQREFHVRELSKLIKKSPTTISKNLKFYAKEGILYSTKKFNHLFFKADTQNPLFRKLKLTYNLSLLENSELISFLEKQFHNPESIILFGSFAKAENSLKSDVDILVVTSNKKELDLSPFEKKIGNPIQLHVYSTKDLEIMKMKNKELLNNFVNGILLRGYFELFK